MKIKALVSFAGAVPMNTGDIADIEEKTAVSLISCGLAEKADSPQKNLTGGEDIENIGNNSPRRKKCAADRLQS